AIQQANDAGIACTITLTQSIYLSEAYNNTNFAFPEITGQIRISGAAHRINRVENENSYGFFNVASGAELTLEWVTLAGANTPAISSSNATVTIRNSMFFGNHGGNGPVDTFSSTVNTVGSTFDGNSGNGSGGIHAVAGTVTITDSVFYGGVGTAAPPNAASAVFSAGATTTITNTILHNSVNTDVPQCAGDTPPTAESSNIASDASCGDAVVLGDSTAAQDLNGLSCDQVTFPAYVGTTESLATAINCANANPDPNVIVVTQDLTVTQVNSENPTIGLPGIYTPITIAGLNADNKTQLSRNSDDPANFGLFYVRAPGRLTLYRMQLSNGLAPYGGAVHVDGDLGSGATLTSVDSDFDNNQAENRAGAVYVDGSSGGAFTRFIDGSFSGNSASASAGAVMNNGINGYWAIMYLTQVEFNNNIAPEGSALVSNGSTGRATVVSYFSSFSGDSPQCFNVDPRWPFEMGSYNFSDGTCQSD
ncbi:MAG: hypothetical protein KC496_04405, partial [Anaerolineae bacterium]|nr:hypothetical protein [Anaerolineae bacterium]